MRICGVYCTALLAAILAPSAAFAAEWGDLSGRFVVEGKLPPSPILPLSARLCGEEVADDTVVVDGRNRLQNAFIYLRTKPLAIAPRYAATAKTNVVLEIENCRFSPHALVLRTSQTLLVRNSDNFNISFQLNALRDHVIRPLTSDSSFEVKLRSAEASPIKLGCSIRPWPVGWVLVRDNPYAAVSAADGSFVIGDLPVDVELQFQLWHERPGRLANVQTGIGAADGKGRLTIRVHPGKNDIGDITVPAALLTSAP